MKVLLKARHTLGLADRGEEYSSRARHGAAGRWYQAQHLLFAGAPLGGQRY